MIDSDSMLNVTGNQPAWGDEGTPIRRWIAHFVLHATVATMGCWLLGMLLLVPLKHVGPLTDVPYSPAFWGVALIIGFVVNRQMLDRGAKRWVASIGFFILILGVASSLPCNQAPTGESSLSACVKEVANKLFGLDPNVCGASECLDRLFLTTPALSSFAYSVGAWLGFASANKRKSSE
jgi:hypothetical protein